jgi:hypothetical protein
MNARRYHGQLRVPVGPQSSGFFPLNSGATLHNLPSQGSSVSSCSVDFIRCPCKGHSPRWCQCGAVSAEEESKNSMTVQDPSIFIGWPETLFCGNIIRQETKRHSEVENSDFILHQWSQISSYSKFQVPNNVFMGFLKGSAGHQVTRNVLGLIGEPVLS